MGKITISNLRYKLSLTVCLILVTCSGIFAQSGITVDFKDTPLKAVLESISNQSKFKFVYTDELKVDGYKVTVSSKDESAQSLFNKVFNPVSISYSIKGNQVVLGLVQAQQTQTAQNQAKPVVKISGIVVEEEGNEPLPGVTIQNITKNKAISSDLDGKYVIDAAPGDKLSFSSIGMSDYETIVGKASVINVSLKPDAIALADVVVTGYQTLSKERATGSFNVIKAEQLEKPASNIASRLIGTSAGVQSSTDKDGNILFEIRGQTRLVEKPEDMQPLVVVDGFPISGGFNTINPNDVENITILKDAAAASIWGAKSANGVIVVTTKSGKNSKKGDLKVEVSTFWKFSPKLDIDYNRNSTSSANVIDYERKGFATNFFGGPWAPVDDSSVSSALTSAYSLAVTAMNENRLGHLSDAELASTLDRLSKLDNRQQLKDHILENPFTQQYNVNIVGNTGRSTQMLSLMYEQNNGTFQGIKNEKYNISYRTNVNVFKWLDFAFGGNFNLTNKKENDFSYLDSYEAKIGNPLDLSPYQMLLNEDGTKTNVSKYYMPNMERYVPMSSFPYSDWSYNPLTEMESKNYKTTIYNIRAQAGLTAKIIKGLTIDSKVQYEQFKSNTKNINDERSYFVRSTINHASTWDKATGKVTANLPSGGILQANTQDVDSYNWRNQLNFNRGFNDDKHQISFIAGTELYSIVTQKTTNPYTYGYDDDRLSVGSFPNGVGGSGVYKLTNWTGASQTFKYTNKYTYATERYFSLFANASYTFNQKYTVSGSYRTDASNLITDDPKYRYAPFWSIGLSWNMIQESFMKNIVWLDRLSLRATYGYNGNVDRSTSFTPLINVTGSQNIYIQDYTASVYSFGNPSLRWEKTGSFDVGVDFSMFSGMLYGKVDFYNKKSKDLIVDMSIPSVNGTKNQKLNAAEMTNRGIELELGTSLNILGNDITWTGGVNFAYNHNMVDKLFKTTYSASDLYGGKTGAFVQGYNANTLWSFKYAGVVNRGTVANPNWQPVVQGKGDEVYDFTGWTPGDGRDYMLDMGTKVAPYTASLVSNFKIYDFNLSFIFTGKFGHKFNGLSFNYPSMSGGSAMPNTAYEDVVNADPSQMVPIPFDKSEPKYYFWDRFYPYLDYLVQNAGHVRCQEINITYNVPQVLLKRIGISRAKLFAQGNNLFVIANNKYNEDPEYSMTKAKNGMYKSPASFTFGVNLTF